MPPGSIKVSPESVPTAIGAVINRRAVTSRATALIARRAEVARMYLEGRTMVEIAKHFGVTHASISKDLSAIRQWWVSSALIDFNEARARELARIDNLEREYWEAWRRSQEDSETHTTKSRSAQGEGEAEDLEVTDRIEASAGDPRFLAGVQWCIERRCQLLGLDRPKTIGVMIGSKDIDRASDAELTMYIISEIAALMQPSASGETTTIDAEAKDVSGASSPPLERD